MMRSILEIIGHTEHITTLLTHLKDFMKEVNGPGTPMRIKQERLQHAREIVGRVILQLAAAGVIPLFIKYLEAAGLPWRNGFTKSQRNTRFAEEKIITATANHSFLPHEIDPTKIAEYEVLVDDTIQRFEKVLETGTIADLEVLIDAALADDLEDWLRDAGHAGIYFLRFIVNPQITNVFTMLDQGVIVKATAELRKIETSAASWANRQVANARDTRPWWRKLVEFWND